MSRREYAQGRYWLLTIPQHEFTPYHVPGCDEEIKKKFEISGPSSHLTSYQPDGTTEIDAEVSPSLLAGGNPLIVKAF